jgi:hypothetical protein
LKLHEIGTGTLLALGPGLSGLGHGIHWSRAWMLFPNFPLSLDWRERPEMAGRTINTSKVLGHRLLTDFPLLFDLKGAFIAVICTKSSLAETISSFVPFAYPDV